MTNPNGWVTDTGETIKALSDEEVTTFFKAVEANADPSIRARDLCLFRLMLSYGLRCEEVHLLSLPHDVDLESDPPRLWVTRVKRKRTKDGRPKPRLGHWYPLTRRNVERLKAWLSARRKFTKAKDGPLFVTMQGRPITANYIYHICARYGVVAGITDLYPHRFRHTTGTRLAAQGASAYEIKEALGHVSVLSSEVYVNLSGPARLKMDLKALATVEDDDD